MPTQPVPERSSTAVKNPAPTSNSPQSAAGANTAKTAVVTAKPGAAAEARAAAPLRAPSARKGPRAGLNEPTPIVATQKEYVPVSSAVTPIKPERATPVNSALRDAWKKRTAESLTEEELLAMPESEYMGELQLAYFKLRLQRMREDLLKNAGETTDHLREDTLTVPDPADRATIEEEHAIELRTRDRERKLMKKITQALALIDSGDYGYCEETGEPIGVPRLLARPTATLSLEAQQRRELKQKLFGD